MDDTTLTVGAVNETSADRPSHDRRAGSRAYRSSHALSECAVTRELKNSPAVQRARHRIVEGYYDQPDVLDAAIDRLLSDLEG